MKKQRNITSSEALSFIQKFCEASKSGTAYLVTEKNIMGQIMINEGRIVSAHYLAKRGMDALDSIFKTKQFSIFNFLETDSTTSNYEDTTLSHTSEILEIIDKWLHGNEITELTYIEKASIASIIDVVTDELKIYLGPIAPMVCKNYFKKVYNPKDLVSALDNIANEIDGADNQTKFKRILMQKIPNIAKVDLDTSYDRSLSLSQVYKIVVYELSLYLGPIAPMLCEEFFKHYKDVDAIVQNLDSLSSKIEDNSQRVEFKRATLKKIQ